MTLPQHFKKNGYRAEWWGKIDHALEGAPRIALAEWHELRDYSGIPREGDLEREPYDHEEWDSLEVRNVVADPAHAETVETLEVRLEHRWSESLE